MPEVIRGFSRTVPQQSRMSNVSLANAPAPTSRTLLEVIRDLDGANTELIERNKTIFFPGDPAEKVYLIRLSYRALLRCLPVRCNLVVSCGM